MKIFSQVMPLVIMMCYLSVISSANHSTNSTGDHSKRTCTVNAGADLSGKDVGSASGVSEPSLCCDKCGSSAGCAYWSWTNWQGGTCWFKESQGNLIPASSVSWGKGSEPSGLSIKILQYNLMGWKVFGDYLDTKGEAIVKYMGEVAPDFIGAEECEGFSDWILHRLPGYAYSSEEKEGVNIFYNLSAWTVEKSGYVNIPEQDQWGQRIMRWTIFQHTETGKGLVFFSTHWCVCSDSRLLNTALSVASTIVDLTPDGYGAILTGDLNVFEGFENSMAVRYLKGQYGESPFPMRDTFRDVHPDADGSTFGAAGKLDYIFASSLLTTNQALIDRSQTNSDHYPVTAEVFL